MSRSTLTNNVTSTLTSPGFLVGLGLGVVGTSLLYRLQLYVGGTTKDKTTIEQLRSENTELKRELQMVDDTMDRTLAVLTGRELTELEPRPWTERTSYDDFVAGTGQENANIP